MDSHFPCGGDGQWHCIYFTTCKLVSAESVSWNTKARTWPFLEYFISPTAKQTSVTSAGNPLVFMTCEKGLLEEIKRQLHFCIKVFSYHMKSIHQKSRYGQQVKNHSRSLSVIRAYLKVSSTIKFNMLHISRFRFAKFKLFNLETLRPKKLIISFWSPAALHFQVPHLTFYSVE